MIVAAYQFVSRINHDFFLSSRDSPAGKIAALGKPHSAPASQPPNHFVLS
jgi:hypothetical protein